MTRVRPIRVMVAKGGLDGHERGAKVVTMGLRDEGMEVIYTGLRQTPEQIVETALQEGVDVIGISTLTGEHKFLLPKIVDLVRHKGMDEVLIIAGGIIPEEDIPLLREIGVSTVFGPGTPIKEIAAYIRQNLRRGK